MRSLYNVTVRVVDLVWAESEEEAVRLLANSDQPLRTTELLDGSAFVSEPVESMGWTGVPA